MVSFPYNAMVLRFRGNYRASADGTPCIALAPNSIQS